MSAEWATLGPEGKEKFENLCQIDKGRYTE